ncbi:MAG: hypothetical protein AAB554_00880 [Patescibacteria group bacterium]
MLNENPNPAASGLDTLIKVLTVLKLMVQLAFYGLMLGGVLWVLLANPLPKLLENIQAQAFETLMNQYAK